jgi:RHS repeat-associated protein
VTTGAAPAVVSSYTYDDSGIRVSQTVDNVTTIYLIDALNPTGYAQILEEGVETSSPNGKLDQIGEIVRAYTLGLDVVTQAAVGQALHLLYDAHGSTRALLNGATAQVAQDGGAVKQVYSYDAYGQLLGFAATPLTNLLYSGELTDRSTGLQYLRARYYDPVSGRFNRLDPFAGDIKAPLSLHKYLYTHGNPIVGIDPSGLEFTLSGQLSVSGIQNMISTSLGYLNTAFRIYNAASRFMQLMDYARTIVRFAQAFQSATPAGAAAALAGELRRSFGLDNVNEITRAFSSVARELGSNWRAIGSRIADRADDIARDVFTAVSPQLVTYGRRELAGTLQFILFTPTGPGGRAGDRIISLSDSFAVGVSPNGGRLFGFGVRDRAQRGFDQWFRIDWFDRRLPQPINVHYHVFQETDAHPGPHRVIWTP